MWVIFDIDGTLADIRHRLHHIEKKPPDWDSFNAAMLHDALKKRIAALLLMCAEHSYKIALVTGRFQQYEVETVRWLKEQQLVWDELHMRQTGDYRSDYIIKEDIYLEHFAKREILFVVDDRDQVVEMWRSKGLTVLQCQKGDY